MPVFLLGVTINLEIVRGIPYIFSSHHFLSTASPESRTPSSNESDTRIDSDQKIDLGLVLRLQRKLASVERDKMHVERRLEELDNTPKVTDAMNAARDSLRISELEMQNSTLKTQLLELQNSINEGTAKAQLLEQLKLAQNELERKAEEIIQLKCVLASQTNNMKTIVNSKSRIGKQIYLYQRLAVR